MLNARPRVGSIVALDGWDESAVLAAAIAGHLVVLGNAARLTERGIPLDNLGEWPDRLHQRGEHVLFVAVDDRAVGFLSVVSAPFTQTHTTAMEDDMRDSQITADHFPTDAANLAHATPTEVITLADGDQFDLRIAPVSKRIGEAVVRMLSYNGSVPGPTLRVRQGSEILVHVVNDGDLEATVHWHGLRLDNRYDGTLATQSAIPVGGTFTYRLSFPDPGVYWYHPHIREDYGQEMGLYGNIVVVPAEPDYWPPAHRELALTLDDILLENGSVAPFNQRHPSYTAMGRFGNVLLPNGETHLSLHARHGEIIRWYLTNTANTRVFNVGVRGARMKLVGGDNGRYEHETFVDDVVIAPSERVVVDVLFHQPGSVTLEHRTPGGTYPLADVNVGVDRPEPSLISQFEILRSHPDFGEERARIATRLAAEPDKTLALVAEMDRGEEDLPPGVAVTYICPMHADVISDKPGKCPKCHMKLIAVDAKPIVSAAAAATDHAHSRDHDDHYPAGIEWEDDMVEVNRTTNPTNMRWKLIDRATGAEGSAIDWRFRVGDQVKIRIVNEMDSDHPMHHPFHIHGAGRFLVLSRDGVTEPNLVWKDTVLIPTGQTVDILLDVTHPGVWMAHCHIAEHHESGMMLHFRVDQ